MDIAKLYRLEAQLEVLAEARRGRHHSYRNRIAVSRELRNEAIAGADHHYQTMSLAELVAKSDEELTAAAVDVKVLRRAAVERHMADAIQRGDPQGDEEFAALSALVPRLRDYAAGAV